MDEGGSYDSAKSYQLLRSNPDVMQSYGYKCKTRSFTSQSVLIPVYIHVLLTLLLITTTVLFLHVISLQIEVNNLKEISKLCFKVCSGKNADVNRNSSYRDIDNKKDTDIGSNYNVSRVQHGYKRSYLSAISNQNVSTQNSAFKTNLQYSLNQEHGEASAVPLHEKEPHLRRKREDKPKAKTRKAKNKRGRRRKKKRPADIVPYTSVQLYHKNQGVEDGNPGTQLTWTPDKTNTNDTSGFIFSDEKHVQVKSEGIYFIYIQMTTSVRNSTNAVRTMFTVYVKDQPLLKCINEHPSSSLDRFRIRQCYSAKVVYMNSGNQIYIKDDTNGTYKIHYKKDMTFWGLFKLK